jgi:hypothetical protein
MSTELLMRFLGNNVLPRCKPLDREAYLTTAYHWWTKVLTTGDTSKVDVTAFQWPLYYPTVFRAFGADRGKWKSEKEDSDSDFDLNFNNCNSDGGSDSDSEGFGYDLL